MTALSPSSKDPARSRRSGSNKRPSSGIRLYGWIEPNPNSEKYDFAGRAYSTRDGLYHARLRYRPQGAKSAVTERELTAETPEELLRVAYDAQLALTQKLRRDRLPSDRRESLVRFVDGLEGYKDEHLARRKQNVAEKEPPQINKWIVPYLGGFTLAELKERGLEIGGAWVEWMRTEQSVTWTTTTGRTIAMEARPPATYRVAAQALEIAKGIFTVYRDRLRVMTFDRNPFDGVAVEKDRSERRARHLEAAIPLAFVESVAFAMWDLRDVALTLALGELGLRQQEAYVLDWPCVLWPGGEPRQTIEISQAVSGTGRRRVIDETKSLSATRRATLHAPTADVFLALWEEQGRPAIEPGSLVFPGVEETSTGEETDGMVNRPGWNRWRFKPALKTLYGDKGVETLHTRYGKLTPHRLRSAAASAAGYAHVSQAEAMMNFGWSRVDTMIHFYMRAYDDPDPALRGLPVAEQIVHARREALGGLPAVRKRLSTDVAAKKALVEQAVADGMGGDERRRRRAHLRDVEGRLARIDLMEQRLVAMIAAAEARA